MLKKTIFTFLSCLLLLNCHGQELLGLATENYSGINSIFLNPANNLTTTLNWDINLIASGQFFDNNIGGFKNSALPELIKRNNDFYLATDFNSDQEFPNGSIVFDFNQPGNKKFIYNSSHILGPSFMVNLEKHSFGVFTGFRALVSGHQIPAVLGYYDYKNILVSSDYNVGPAIISGMAWGEIGVNYLYKAKTNIGLLGIAINLKYLQGYESFFIHNNSLLNNTRLDRDVISFNRGADIEFGFTTSSIDREALHLRKNGNGFGLDIGTTVASPDYPQGSGYKLGLSLIDLGKIRFNKLTEVHKIDIDNSFLFNPRNLDDVSSFRDGLNQLNEELFNGTRSTLSGDNYTLWLPGALCLQADFAIRENLFLNTTLLHRIAFNRKSASRGHLLAITPRFESRWITGFIPVSIFNYRHAKIGAAIRLGFLTLGSEDLLSFFSQRNLNSSDAYIALKLNPLNLGWEKRSRKNIECYEF